MSYLELLLRWLINRLLPQAEDGFPVIASVEAPGLRWRPAPAACLAVVSQDARWAKFNRPPKRCRAHR
ncbi:hypothetical protein [Algisphaera agarilytica]|uniref:Uncharacterized protein n=1 Tax=Algisphaera agarilytica TaxID=1385975 RepID=A0A7X0H422_9BACT|nr:hypothetical protein [Algisphaera agarilytica]MBB6428698.1 hypothetical protein [Algisphaera agarilytica]